MGSLKGCRPCKPQSNLPAEYWPLILEVFKNLSIYTYANTSLLFVFSFRLEICWLCHIWAWLSHHRITKHQLCQRRGLDQTIFNSYILRITFKTTTAVQCQLLISILPKSHSLATNHPPFLSEAFVYTNSRNIVDIVTALNITALYV